MSTTPEAADTTADPVYEAVLQALVEECEIARDSVTPDSNLATDFGLDSLAFIDLCFALDTRFGIRIPFEEWVNAINSGQLDPAEAFRMRTVVEEVAKLVRAKPA